MKRCPECRRDYFDDSLLYCLDDGAALLEGPASGGDRKTEIIKSPDSQRTGTLTEGETKVLPAGSSRKIFTTPLVVLVGVLFVGLAGGSWWLTKTVSPPTAPGPQREIKFVRLTTGGKAGDEPIVGGTTISPDGKYVVFWTNGGPGKASIWLRQVSTNSLQRILGPFEGDQNGSTFSRNGELLYFVSFDSANPQGALFQIPILGGVPPRRILERVSSPVTFSPDEKEVAFVRVDQSNGESSLVVANADGSDTPRTIATRKMPEFFSADGPSWSPDGKVIASGAGTISPSIRGSIVEVPARGGEERMIATAQWARIARVLWLPDGSGLVADGYATPFATGTQIWHISYPDGNVRKLTNDLNGYGQVSLGLTADGNTIATVQEDYSQPIFIADPNQEAARERQISSGKYEGRISLDTTPDGRIVYCDPSPDANDIWIMNGDGSEKKQVTHDQFLKSSARVSPDGRYIVFSSNRLGTINIWRIDIDGSNLKQLTEGGTLDGQPVVSPDGKWVIFTSLRSGANTLWKTSIEGGEAVQVMSRPAFGASISPDGKFIACMFPDEKASLGVGLGLLPFDGSEFVKTLEMPTTAVLRAGVAWVPDGNAITYLDESTGYTNIVSRSFDGGPVKPLTNFKMGRGYSMFNFAWTRDGKHLVYSRGPLTDDVVLIKDFR